ncbi:hypothetical protein SanaruYs_38910 [Chryseotalea sanaruensis]|uniref:Uncharacterized protein n=1 Tax=Chryseotalea sanaruensis TaxID=2482724 RepID=A0A401UFI3_9BACT|nr:hypothetical protein [Chryseotalea sanaruensis]GCC53646.1 hypothetical protein SanaruYs_38910 [Chryseotalea sanaruensis]
MKKIFVIVLLFASLAANAQRVKYKDLFPTLTDMSASEQLSALRDFIGYELDHPNANFRLALLHERNYRQANPLTQYESVMAHAAETGNRYLKSKQLVTEQQVRSDNEYYAPIFGQFDSKGKLYAPFPFVQGKIQRGYDSAMLIQQKLPAIYKSFTKSVNQYDKAVKLFAQISTTYKSEEDIYMFYSVAFEKQMDELISYYDSSLFYFNNYLSLTKDYPLPDYKQQLIVNEIKTYRLDGLINRMTFLEDKVLFWNYKQWVERIKVNYKSEILTMQEQLSTNEKKITEVLNILKTSSSADLVRIDKELIYKLNNYDKNSLALALLRYKSFKQEWMLKEKLQASDTLLNQRLELYSTLIQQNRIADSLYQDLQTSITNDNIIKHQQYLKTFYGGKSGLDKFTQEENSLIKKSLTDYHSNLKVGLLTSLQRQEVVINKSLKFGSASIPLFTSDSIPGSLDNSTWITQKKLISPDGSTYLLGVGKPDKKNNNLVSFIARVNPDGKAGWMQNYSFSIDSAVVDANNSIQSAILTQEGCAFVVTSTHITRPESINTFVYITEKKEEKLKKKLKEVTVLRDLLYVEETNTFVLTFKGNSLIQSFTEEETLSVQCINVLGDLVWRRDISFAGTLQKVVRVRDGFVLAGNFTLLRDSKGKEIRTRIATGQTNPYLIKLSARGDVQRILPLVSDKSIYLDQLVKVNDGSLNVLAYESTFSDLKKESLNPETLKHVMVNYELRVILSSL